MDPMGALPYMSSMGLLGLYKKAVVLKMFARKSSNIDFFIRILLQLGYELLLSEMKKKLGGHRLRFGDKIFERPP